MEWMCAECGEPHPKNSPPCKNCGAMQFEKTVVRIDPDEDAKPSGIEWQCTECGRTHPKNSPPCSRCGNMHLEAIELGSSFDEAEITAGLGLFDVAKYAGALVVVGILVFAFVNAGLLTGSSPPTVENVPGDANYSSGLDLSTVEYQIYENVNDERSSEGVETLSLAPDTTEIADYYNKRMVKSGERPADGVSEEFGSCSNRKLVYNLLQYDSGDRRPIDAYGSEDELAGALSSSWLKDSGTRPVLLDDSASSMGIDVHVTEDGTVYATVVYC